MHKILGGTDPVTNELFQLTQGIGQGESGLVPIDESTNGGNVTIQTESIMTAASFNTQLPSGVDTPLQLEFGAPQATPEFSLDASGNFTCLEEDEYILRLRLEFGRSTNPGNAVLFGRALIGGVQLGNSVVATLDDSDDVIPATFSGPVAMTVGQVLTVEIYRDSVGSNNGGVYSVASTLGWNDAPSCQLLITRQLAVAM